MQQKKKVMITGGSSFVGRYLTSVLSEEKNEIISVYHQHLPEPMPGVFPVCSDFSSPSLLAAPMRDIHTVYHLAWAYNLRGQPNTALSSRNGERTETQPINLLMTENIIRAMENLKVPRIIFVSAIGAHKKATHPFLREKYMAELSILNSNIPEKVIVRCAPICGGEGTSDRMTYAIEKLLKTPLFYPIPHSNKSISPVHIDFVTSFLAKLSRFDLGPYKSVLYELSGSQVYTVRELFQGLASKRGLKSKIAMGGFMGDSIAPLFDRVKKEEKDFLRFRDYLDLVGHFDKYVNQANPIQTLIPEKIDGFEKIIAPPQ